VKTGFVTTSDRISIAHAEMGSGPVVVFVRGWISHLELQWEEPSFRAFFERLGRHLTVVLYDHRGMGLSDREIGTPSLDDFVCDLEAVIDRLGDQRVGLWGSSFGGPIALAYADRHPDRVARLLLEGTYYAGDDLRTSGERAMQRQIVSMFATAPDVAATSMSYLTDPEPGTRHEARAGRVLSSLSPAYLRYLYTLSSTWDVRDTLPRIAVPTLVLHRRGSRVFSFENARRLAAEIPGAELAGLAGEAHNPWEGDSDPPLSRMIRFFSGVATAAPTTTITLMITDIVGSTATTNEIGDAAAQVRRRDHDAIVTDSAARHGGSVIKHMGDGSMTRFSSASAALRCAREVRAALEARNARSPGAPLLVRIGLNAGEPVEEDNDVFGAAVNLTARVCAAAEGGQILLTSTVRDLAAGHDFVIELDRDHELKGFRDPVALHALIT
jgi:class 3 adenylate cyclase/alpha-beta hydrolase superfamily lysophospholipase